MPSDRFNEPVGYTLHYSISSVYNWLYDYPTNDTDNIDTPLYSAIQAQQQSLATVEQLLCSDSFHLSFRVGPSTS